MTEVLWPPDLCPSSQTWNIIGNAATFTSPLSGATRTYGRPGARLGCTMTFPPMRGQDRARLLAFINTLLDRSNRVWVPDFSTTRRGSFSVPELLTNNDFSKGTAGWTVSRASASVADRTFRLTNSKSNGTDNFATYQSITSFTANSPYSVRAFVSGQSRSSLSKYISDGVGTSATATGAGAIHYAFVPNTASWGNVFVMIADGVTGMETVAGDYVDLSYTSIARCALVDGGANLLSHSDQFDNAAWTPFQSSITANSASAPDGTVTADTLGENGAAATVHGVRRTSAVTVSSSAADYQFSVAVKQGTRTWVMLQMNDGINAASVSFNVGTGVVGTATTETGWGNVRGVISSLGSNWYQCTILARKTGSQTSIIPTIYIAEADNDVTFSGASAASLYVWRATFSSSSVPARLVQSTSAAVSASSQTGAGIYVKGLPASTQGLLEAGDPVQIGGQINFLTARLNSDAAGKGYLQCGRPWLAATNDAPVIVHQPMCKMILATDTLDLDTGPGQFSPFQIELVEAIE